MTWILQKIRFWLADFDCCGDVWDDDPLLPADCPGI